MGPCLQLSSWLSALEIEATKEGLREPRSSSRLRINRQTWTSKQFEVIETPSIQKLWRRRGMKLGRWLCGHEDTARPKRINSWYCSWLKFCADSYFVTFFAGFEKFDNVLFDMKWCMISTYFNQQAPRRFFMLGKVLRDRRFSPLGFWCPKNLMEGSGTCFHCAVVQVVPPPNQSYGFDLSAVLLTISGKVPAFSSWCLKHECQQSPNFVLPVRNRYLQIHSVQLSIRPMQRVPTRQVGTLSSEYWDSQRVRRDVFWTMLPFRSGPYFK